MPEVIVFKSIGFGQESILWKAEWDESEHPRNDKGEFESADGDSSGQALDPHAAEFIEKSAAKFYAAGGMIETYSRQRDSSGLQEVISQQWEDLKATMPPEDDRTDEQWRLLDGYRYMLEAIKDHQNDSGQLLVAMDEEGTPVAVISYEIHGGEDGELAIGNLGSSGRMPGAATALEHEIAWSAKIANVGVYSLCTQDSRPYHELIGRTVTGKTSRWSAEQCKQISALNPRPEDE
jgi:hypothetical protein